jgi:hypothetical protein
MLPRRRPRSPSERGRPLSSPPWTWVAPDRPHSSVAHGQRRPRGAGGGTLPGPRRGRSHLPVQPRCSSERGFPRLHPAQIYKARRRGPRDSISIFQKARGKGGQGLCFSQWFSGYYYYPTGTLEGPRFMLSAGRRSQIQLSFFQKGSEARARVGIAATYAALHRPSFENSGLSVR